MNSLEQEALAFIANYEIDAGIIDVNYLKNNYEKYLNLSESDLNKFSKADCAKAQFVLYQYAMGINKKIQKLKTVININKKELNRIYALFYKDFKIDGAPYEIIIANIENNSPDRCFKLADRIAINESLVNENENILNDIHKLCGVLNALSWSKGKE